MQGVCRGGVRTFHSKKERQDDPLTDSRGVTRSKTCLYTGIHSLHIRTRACLCLTKPQGNSQNSPPDQVDEYGQEQY